MIKFQNIGHKVVGRKNKIVKDNDPALVYRHDVTSFKC